VLALTIVVAGGMANVAGAIAGAIVLVGAPELFRPLQEVRILAQIARCAIEASSRAKLLAATTLSQAVAVLAAAPSPRDSRTVRRASLADI